MSLHVTLCHFIIPRYCYLIYLFIFGYFFCTGPSFLFEQAKRCEMNHQCLPSILLATLTSTFVTLRTQTLESRHYVL